MPAATIAGGLVSGVIAPDKPAGCGWSRRRPGRASRPARRRHPTTIPNNHLSYAIQWFLFARIAVVIYGSRCAGTVEARRRPMAELTRLANGLTVAIDPMPGAQSAAIGLYAVVGSRSEAGRQGRLAHLVEHMVFKGARRPRSRAIAEAIEDVGGDLNAWTARDQTVFHARTLAPTSAWRSS